MPPAVVSVINVFSFCVSLLGAAEGGQHHTAAAAAAGGLQRREGADAADEERARPGHSSGQSSTWHVLHEPLALFLQECARILLGMIAVFGNAS